MPFGHLALAAGPHAPRSQETGRDIVGTGNTFEGQFRGQKVKCAKFSVDFRIPRPRISQDQPKSQKGQIWPLEVNFEVKRSSVSSLVMIFGFPDPELVRINRNLKKVKFDLWRSMSRSKGHVGGGCVTGYGKGQHPYDTGPKGFHLTYDNMDLWEIQFSPMPLTCKYGDLWPHPLDAGVMTQSGQNEVKLPWGRPIDWYKKIRSNRLSTYLSLGPCYRDRETSCKYNSIF